MYKLKQFDIKTNIFKHTGSAVMNNYIEYTKREGFLGISFWIMNQYFCIYTELWSNDTSFTKYWLNSFGKQCRLETYNTDFSSCKFKIDWRLMNIPDLRPIMNIQGLRLTNEYSRLKID